MPLQNPHFADSGYTTGCASFWRIFEVLEAME